MFIRCWRPYVVMLTDSAEVSDLGILVRAKHCAAIHYLQLSHISIYSCYPLPSAIPHLNILLLSTTFSYPTSQYTPAIHYLQLSHISIYFCYPLPSAIPHLNILLLSTVFSYPTSQYTPAPLCSTWWVYPSSSK